MIVQSGEIDYACPDHEQGLMPGRLLNGTSSRLWLYQGTESNLGLKP